MFIWPYRTSSTYSRRARAYIRNREPEIRIAEEMSSNGLPRTRHEMKNATLFMICNDDPPGHGQVRIVLPSCPKPLNCSTYHFRSPCEDYSSSSARYTRYRAGDNGCYVYYGFGVCRTIASTVARIRLDDRACQHCKQPAVICFSRGF